MLIINPITVLCLLLPTVLASATKDDLKFAKQVYDELLKARSGRAIPYSPNLAKVAQIHCEDLKAQHAISSKYCNMHSWYLNGQADDSRACCYTEDHKAAGCMWEKPKQLSNYKENGYEVAYYATGYLPSAEKVIEGFRNSPGHNKVIMNLEGWKDPWLAVGVGHSGPYTTIWFGKELDPETGEDKSYPDPDKKYPEVKETKPKEKTEEKPEEKPEVKWVMQPKAEDNNKAKETVTVTVTATATATATATEIITSIVTQQPTSTSSTNEPTGTATCTFNQELFQGDIWYRKLNVWFKVPKLQYVKQVSLDGKTPGYFKVVEDEKKKVGYTYKRPS